jgi:hypothetical protein
MAFTQVKPQAGRASNWSNRSIRVYFTHRYVGGTTVIQPCPAPRLFFPTAVDAAVFGIMLLVGRTILRASFSESSPCIVYMGGAFEVRGNTTPAAEMNVWYDAEAARAVIREPIEQVFIPLDVTGTVPLTKAIFDKVTVNKDDIISKLLLESGFVRALQRLWVAVDIQRFDNERFYNLYIDLLTRPVPVRIGAPGQQNTPKKATTLWEVA